VMNNITRQFNSDAKNAPVNCDVICIKGEHMGIFGAFSNEDARVEKNDGSVVGPYKAIFAGTAIIIPEAHADIEEG